MNSIYSELVHMPLFQGIAPEELQAMMKCIGAYARHHKKGSYIAFSEEPVRCVSVVLQGCVHMISEDIWGSKALLVVMHKGELFGESFACGTSMAAVVSFQAAEEVRALYMPFERVMHSCPNSCQFHHRLVENMLTRIADKNVQLMQKVKIISQKTLRDKILTYLSLQVRLQGSRRIELPLGRIGLAEYLCADRSALTRELVRMREEGIIEYHRNSFELL